MDTKISSQQERKQSLVKNRLQEERRQSLAANKPPHHCTSNAHKRIEREQENLRKQQLRLENEKQKIQAQKIEELQRRMSQQSDPTPKKVASQDRDTRLSVQQASPASKSFTTYSPGSKLFDYEKESRPRSHRELVQSNISAETSSRIPSPSSRVTGASSRTGQRGSLTPAISLTGERKTSTSRTADLGERKVNFDDDKLGAEIKYQRPRSKSVADTTQAGLPAVQVEGKDEDTQRLKDLYNIAIEKVKSVDESFLAEARSAPGSRTKVFSNTSFSSGFDVATLRELESILKDARSFSKRRSSKEDHASLDAHSKRAQKKRIERLETVLRTLKPEDQQAEFDPMKVLQCSYLRLSKSNIEALEDMCRQEGRDPGIHVHKDVTDYDIWEGLQEERRDKLAVRDSLTVPDSLTARRDSLTVPDSLTARRDSLTVPGSLTARRGSLTIPDSVTARRGSLTIPK